MPVSHNHSHPINNYSHCFIGADSGKYVVFCLSLNVLDKFNTHSVCPVVLLNKHKVLNAYSIFNGHTCQEWIERQHRRIAPLNFYVTIALTVCTAIGCIIFKWLMIQCVCCSLLLFVITSKLSWPYGRSNWTAMRVCWLHRPISLETRRHLPSPSRTSWCQTPTTRSLL